MLSTQFFLIGAISFLVGAGMLIYDIMFDKYMSRVIIQIPMLVGFSAILAAVVVMYL